MQLDLLLMPSLLMLYGGLIKCHHTMATINLCMFYSRTISRIIIITSCLISRFPGVQKPIDQYGTESSSCATGGDDDDDDDFDPFASDDDVRALVTIIQCTV